MSGTGKSTLLAALKASDNIIVDLDYDNWCIYDEAAGERMIDLPRVLSLFDANGNQDIFLAGCEVNQGALYPYLTAVFVLTAPLSVMQQRIRNRQNNFFGKTTEEWEQIVRDKKEIEPLLIQGSHFVCNTDKDISLVVQEINGFLRRLQLISG